MQLERALASLDSITAITAPNKFAGHVGQSPIDNHPAILRDFYAFLKKGDGGWADLVLDQGNLDDAIQCFLSQSGTEYLTAAAEDRHAAMAATNRYPMLDSNGKYVLDDKNEVVMIENANLSHDPYLVQQQDSNTLGTSATTAMSSDAMIDTSLPPVSEDQEVLRALAETLRLSVLTSGLFDEFNFQRSGQTVRPGSGIAHTLRALNAYVNQREKPLHRTYFLTNAYNKKLKIRKQKTYKSAVFRSQYDWFRTTLTSRQREMQESFHDQVIYMCIYIHICIYIYL
jgi:hypothetical protein